MRGQEDYKHMREAIRMEGKRKDVWVHVIEKKAREETQDKKKANRK